MSPDRRRRDPDRPSKGDLRRLEILDATEKRLGLDGFDALTVEAITVDAGLSRASLYFYFGSKREVVTALVERTMTELAAGAAPVNERRDALAAVRSSIDVTVGAWREHGTVMRAAVELGPVVPEIARLWDDTVARFIEAMTPVVRSAGVRSDGASAEELAHALYWMTERVLYRACVDGTDLDRAADICAAVWTSALG